MLLGNGMWKLESHLDGTETPVERGAIIYLWLFSYLAFPLFAVFWLIGKLWPAQVDASPPHE